jgi:hypothetical protein
MLSIFLCPTFRQLELYAFDAKELVVYFLLCCELIVPAVKQLICEELCLITSTKVTYMEIKTSSLSKLVTKLVNQIIHEAQFLEEDRKCL